MYIFGRHWYGWSGLGGGDALVNEACCSKSMWAHFLAFPGTTEEGREIWFELAFRPGKCSFSDWPAGGTHVDIRTPTGMHKSGGAVLCQTIFDCWDSDTRVYLLTNVLQMLSQHLGTPTSNSTLLPSMSE